MKMDEQKGLDWREQLEMETGIHFRTVNPEEIEKESFLTIKKELGEAFLASYPKEQLPVLLRVIHTTADFSYRDSLVFANGAMEAANQAIQRGLPIITDTTMAASGINKGAAAAFGVSVHCFVGDEDVREEAKRRGVTRSAVSAEKAARLYPECIYAVGNAPTALIRLYELIREGRFRPALIIGMPVGFVNVAEAKELILKTGLPVIAAMGRKGGSNTAAAVCNALLRIAGENRIAGEKQKKEE